jgi:pectinesterase
LRDRPALGNVWASLMKEMSLSLHEACFSSARQAASSVLLPVLAVALLTTAPLPAQTSATTPRPLTVASDGSGDFKTIQEAVAAAPDNSSNRTVITIRAGTYKGHVEIPTNKPNLTLRGTNAALTILTDDKNIFALDPKGNKLGTPDSSTVLVRASGFTAENLTFENTAGNHGQALALFITADRGTFRRCRFLGWQDTLRADAKEQSARQYFEECEIVGHVDFIYAAGTAVFNRCHIHCLADGYITAASTRLGVPYGYVFLDCRITTEPTVTGVYLGRPWRPNARVVYLNTKMPAQIHPEGWHNWNNVTNETTAYYAEYHSKGPGARPESRVKWSHQLTDEEAMAYTVQNILRGTDGWNPAAN